jgi:hypothetical protein
VNSFLRNVASFVPTLCQKRRARPPHALDKLYRFMRQSQEASSCSTFDIQSALFHKLYNIHGYLYIAHIVSIVSPSFLYICLYKYKGLSQYAHCLLYIDLYFSLIPRIGPRPRRNLKHIISFTVKGRRGKISEF